MRSRARPARPPRARAQTHRDGNPWSGSTCHNCNEACCERREPPRVLPRAIAAEPERLGDTCHLIGGGQKEHEEDHSSASDGLRTAPQDSPLPDV